MAKISFGRVPTVTVRRALGIKARRAGAGQICIKGALTGKHYSKPPMGMGGRNNVEVHRLSMMLPRVAASKSRKPDRK